MCQTREWGCQKWQFSLLSLAISSEALQVRPRHYIVPCHLYTDPNIRDLEWPFYAKCSFLASSRSRFTYTDSAMISMDKLISTHAGIFIYIYCFSGHRLTASMYSTININMLAYTN